MDDHLLRLLWAFPLVIFIGVAVLLGLSRLLGKAAPHTDTPPAIEVLTTQTVSPHMQATVVRYGHHQYMVFEASGQLSVQALHTPTGTTPPEPQGLASWLLQKPKKKT